MDLQLSSCDFPLIPFEYWCLVSWIFQHCKDFAMEMRIWLRVMQGQVLV